MKRRVGALGLALVSIAAQAASWMYLGHTTYYDLYIDSASIQRRENGRVTFRVKREYSLNQESGQPFGTGEEDFVAMGDLVADCATRTISVTGVTIRSPTGKLLGQDRGAAPVTTSVEPGTAGELELNAACGFKQTPAAPHG